MHSGLPRFWLHNRFPGLLLAPLGWLMQALVAVRRRFYLHGVLRSQRLPVPVIVVGNIFIGGTGKTPLVAWLCGQLQHMDFKPGIVLRGYGGRSPQWPQRVFPDSDPSMFGDEAVLLAQQTGAPVAAGPDRVAAAKLLLDADCDVIISDDGLQHYALARDIEIIVIDAARGLGNGRCLPAGPLREPPSRLQTADMVIANGLHSELTPYRFTLLAQPLQALEPNDAEPPAGGAVHAITGIGNPQRFFEALRAQGFQPIEHAYPDHHPFQPDELNFSDELPILMTSKDAVKIAAFADQRCWVLPVRAELEPDTEAALIALLKGKLP